MTDVTIGLMVVVSSVTGGRVTPAVEGWDDGTVVKISKNLYMICILHRRQTYRLYQNQSEE